MSYNVEDQPEQILRFEARKLKNGKVEIQQMSNPTKQQMIQNDFQNKQNIRLQNNQDHQLDVQKKSPNHIYMNDNSVNIFNVRNEQAKNHLIFTQNNSKNNYGDTGEQEGTYIQSQKQYKDSKNESSLKLIEKFAKKWFL